MRRLALLVAILACLAATPTSAGPGGCTTSPWLTSIGQEAITVSSTSIGFTAAMAFPTGGVQADLAVVVVETDSIRTRADGAAPTASVGQIFVATATAPNTFTVCGGPNIRNLRMIRVTTDATATAEYYRQGP